MLDPPIRTTCDDLLPRSWSLECECVTGGFTWGHRFLLSVFVNCRTVELLRDASWGLVPWQMATRSVDELVGQLCYRCRLCHGQNARLSELCISIRVHVGRKGGTRGWRIGLDWVGLGGRVVQVAMGMAGVLRSTTTDRVRSKREALRTMHVARTLRLWKRWDLGYPEGRAEHPRRRSRTIAFASRSLHMQWPTCMLMIGEWDSWAATRRTIGQQAYWSVICLTSVIEYGIAGRRP
jgi:hypothetical protein